MLLAIYLSSCTNDNAERPKKIGTDSLKEEIIIEINKETNILNELLEIQSEVELKEIFGAENVSQDTIWGAEGEISMGTYLFNNTDEKVCISWEDNEKRINLTNASIDINWTEDYGYNPNTKWKTKQGFTIGTPLNELVKYNGKVISFFGFGWDYSGMVTSFNGGKLEKEPIGFQLGVTLGDESGYNSTELFGDMELSSSDSKVIEAPIIVFSISVNDEYHE